MSKMSREEAIELINDVMTDAVYQILSEEKEALQMAIQALSQEPAEKPMTVDEMEREYEKSKALFHKIVECDDAVSREAVVQTIEDAKNAGELTFARTIKRIMELPPVNPQYTGNEFFNFDAPMVKKSMEQDAISREAALNSLIDNTHLDGYDLAEALDAIENKEKLPSVTQKSGKWLITPMSNIAYCSECDYLFKDIPASIVEHFNYCPNCGARMESEE